MCDEIYVQHAVHVILLVKPQRFIWPFMCAYDCRSADEAM